MKKCKIFTYLIFFISLMNFFIIGCGKDEERINREQVYFYDGNVANENGEFDKAIESYKLFINSINDEDEAIIQYVFFQLARIYFSKENFDSAIAFANKVKDSDLSIESYLLEEDTYVDYGPRGSSTETEVSEITSFVYSLKSKAKTIKGLSYLKKLDYDKAIESFEEIKPKSASYFYLALSYGLKGDIEEQRSYFEKNLEKGTVGLIKTSEWLRKNPKSN